MLWQDLSHQREAISGLLRKKASVEKEKHEYDQVAAWWDRWVAVGNWLAKNGRQAEIKIIDQLKTYEL